MANERNLKPFKKGNPGGPGRPRNPAELQAIKQMTKGEFSLLIHKLIDLKPEELKDFKGTVLEMAMASAMQQAIKSGDFSRIQPFIERLFGRVKDQVEISTVRHIVQRIDGTQEIFTNEGLDENNS